MVNKVEGEKFGLLVEDLHETDRLEENEGRNFCIFVDDLVGKKRKEQDEKRFKR